MSGGSTGRRGSTTGEHVAFAACLLASLAVCTWIVRHVQSPFGDLIGLHTDHLHHVRATWTFWKRGFEVYRIPLGTTATAAPYPVVKNVPWPDFPVAYPPGMFAVFALPTWVGARHPEMDPQTFAKLTLWWVVLLSHVAIVGVWRALSVVRGARAPLLVGIFLLLWRMCLFGFYDAIWLGCAGCGIAALAARRPGRSLVWFTAAALINYRAAAVAPAALWAAWLLLRSDTAPWRKALLFATTGAIGVLLAWCFWAFTRGSPPPTSAAYEAAASHLMDDKLLAKLVWAAGIVVAFIALVSRDVLVAVTVLLATWLTMHHAGHSWHGSLILGAGLLVGVANPRAPVAFLRGVLTMWIFGLWELAYDDVLFSVVNTMLHAKLT